MCSWDVPTKPRKYSAAAVQVLLARLQSDLPGRVTNIWRWHRRPLSIQSWHWHPRLSEHNRLQYASKSQQLSKNLTAEQTSHPCQQYLSLLVHKLTFGNLCWKLALLPFICEVPQYLKRHRLLLRGLQIVVQPSPSYAQSLRHLEHST
jgi:hypothetical protein